MLQGAIFRVPRALRGCVTAMSRRPCDSGRFPTVEADATYGFWKFFDRSYVFSARRHFDCTFVPAKVMSLPLRSPIPPAPNSRDDFAGLEDLDRPELDEAPDTDPMLVPLDWDGDNESGIVPRRR